MEKESTYKVFLKKVETLTGLPQKYKEGLKTFFSSYIQTLQKQGLEKNIPFKSFDAFIEILKAQIENPYEFEPYHEQLTSPIDYYTFGLEFVRPLIDKEHSTLKGLDQIDKIAALLERKDNVILLSNHQTEPDPQAITLLLENSYPKLGKEMIFVAGARVTTDPLAVPFSLGLNLLCIYSKRYIDHPPDLKLKKQLHNKRTMEKMSELLKEGGKCIWVAPSGGRDRRDAQGLIEVAPFDPQSIEMFYLMAQKASHPTHFFPLTLDTYDLLPPPETIQLELGEERLVQRGAIHLAFGEEILMDYPAGNDSINRHERRKMRAEHIHNIVKETYSKIKS